MIYSVMMRKLYFLLPVLVLPAGFLGAQTLTRDEAVRIALKNNLGIQLATNNVAIAGIYNSYGVAGGLPLVTGTVSDQEQLTSLKQTFSNPANNKTANNASSNNLSASVNGYMLLYNGQ